MHEQMIGVEDAAYAYEYEGHYKILPQIFAWSKDARRIKDGKPLREGFFYSSDNNEEWMTIETLRKWISDNQSKIGDI